MAVAHTGDMSNGCFSFIIYFLLLTLPTDHGPVSSPGKIVIRRKIHLALEMSIWGGECVCMGGGRVFVCLSEIKGWRGGQRDEKTE